jgi:phosphatidylglycerophosphatase A
VSPAVVAATTLGLGRWPWGPGTFTSAIVTLAAYALRRPGPLGLGLAGAATALAGALVATAAERELGRDAGAITIDETAGMLLALAAAPRSPFGYLMAFALFRAFDILKPPPLDALQRLPAGIGVVADDLAAAAYAALVLLALRLVGPHVPWLSGVS